MVIDKDHKVRIVLRSAICERTDGKLMYAIVGAVGLGASTMGVC